LPGGSLNLGSKNNLFTITTDKKKETFIDASESMDFKMY